MSDKDKDKSVPPVNPDDADNAAAPKGEAAEGSPADKAGDASSPQDITAQGNAPLSDDEWRSYGPAAPEGGDAPQIPQEQADKETAEVLELDRKEAALEKKRREKAQTAAEYRAKMDAESAKKGRAAIAAMAAAAAATPRGKIFDVPWKQGVLILLTTCMCMIVQTLSMNTFQNNVNHLEGYYHASVVETTWMVSAYMGPYASFSILLSKIRSQVGMRRFTIVAICCFIICSLCCVFVHDLKTMLVARFISGLTTAPLSSIGCIATIKAFSPRYKITAGAALAMMYISAGNPLARMAGPILLGDGQIHRFFIMEAGAAMLILVLMYFARIPMDPPENVMGKLDFLSYPLLALGLGLNAAMLPIGKFYWWMNADWIGWCFAIAIVCVTACALVELNRRRPMLDFRWLFSREMLHITLVMMTFRILVSNQTGVLSGFFSNFGLLNDQLTLLYAIAYGGSITGCLTVAIFMKPGKGDLIYLIGALAIAAGSFYYSFSTNLTRAEQMYCSQFLIGFGWATFMGVSMSKGLLKAFASGRGKQVFVTWLGAFLFSQCTGNLIGSAVFGTMQIYIEKFHSYILTQHLTLTDPIVAARADAYAHAYSGVIADKGLLRAEGLSMLAKKATSEANVLAYNDIFRIYAWIAVALFCLLVIRIAYKALRDRRAAAGQPLPHNT